jgi:hypothetical protein
MAALTSNCETKELEATPSSDEDEEDTDFDCQSMWLHQPLPPLWKGPDEDPLLPPLIERYDGLTITEKRIQHKLAIALRETEWSNELQKQVPAATLAHELGLQIVRTMRDRIDAVTEINTCKKDLSRVMEELRLDYPLKLGGPLSLSNPSSMSEDVVFYAQINWEYFRASTVNWTDSATLQWVRFALMNSHNDHLMKNAALCLLGRVQTGLAGLPPQGRKAYNYEMHESRDGGVVDAHDHSKTSTMRHPDSVFEDIKEPARFCSLSLMETLNNYSEENELRSTSSLGGIAAPDDHQLTPAELEACGGDKLSQVAFLPFLRREFQDVVESAKCGYFHSMYYEMGCRGMMLILAHFLQERHFNAQTESIGTSEAEGGPRHRLAPCKTLARIYAKADSDHKNSPLPVTAQNVDVCRKSICSSDTLCPLKTFDELKSKFRVLRVKNTFASNPVETLGMMQILVNVLLEPKCKMSGTVMTYGDMLTLDGGRCFEQAVASACNANPGSSYNSCIRQSASLFSKIPGLENEPIRMIVEVQLHLSWFLEQRKLTHLWFKVLRSETLKHLNMDCSKFRNGPAEVKKMKEEEQESSSSNSSTDDEDDEEGINVYAACDECECDLFLLSQHQDCAKGHGLVSSVVGSSAQTTCFLCDQQVLSGLVVHSCRELCVFDVCKECYDNEWWHGSGGRDYCRKDFLRLAEQEKINFVKVETKTNIGADMNDYFGEE